MKKTNVAELRSHLSSLLDYVQKGKTVQIEKRNVPIAQIIPIEVQKTNRTKLGSGVGSVKFLGDVVESAFSNEWETLL